MKKVIITIINIISVMPILFYPASFIAGLMSFDAEGSGESILAWTIFLVSTLYPIFIIVCIILSRKKNSLWLALIALLPLLVLLFVFFAPIETAQKDDYNTLSRDFICNSNSFLTIDGRGIDLLKKENFLTYEHQDLAFVENGSIKIYPNNVPFQEAKYLLSNCKNKEGKSLLDVYELVSD